MARYVGLGALIAVATLVAGCSLGRADLVRRDQYGGTLALKGHRGAAMEDAQQMMAAHCRGQYTIVSEEQVVVGEQTSTGSRTDYGEEQGRRTTRGAQTTQTTTTTEQLTEYHVTYQCGGGPAVAGPPPQQVPAQQAPAPQAQPQAQPGY